MAEDIDPDEAKVQALLDKLSSFPVDKLVKLFVKTREAKAVVNRAHEVQLSRFDRLLEGCENHMLAKADAAGVEGFKTEFGTTYTAETKKISIADGSIFYDFVREKGDLDFFEKRVSSTHVDNYMKVTEGVPPPGLNIFRARVMRVRKAGAK